MPVQQGRKPTMDGTFAIPLSQAPLAPVLVHRSKGCLVDGCPCKDARIVSTRQARFFATIAKSRGQTADRIIAPEAGWSLPVGALD
jgi:hypothetical protein